MKEGLEILYTLQQYDDQLRETENLIKEIPGEIKKVEEERDGRNTIIENARAKLNENIKKREKLEKDILLVKEKIKKYKEQMSKATTNKEYQGFIAEIGYEESNIGGIEEKIIELMLESDEIMNEIRSSEAEFDKIVTEYNAKIKDLKTGMEYQKSKLGRLSKEKKELRTKISSNLLHAYDVLAKNKNGKAISYVETEFCGICNMMVRPQRLNELISSNEICLCENCGRILFKKIDVQKEEPEEGPQ